MVHRNINVAARYHEFVISPIMMRLPDKLADPIAGPLPVALPAVPGVQKIGKPIICDARNRPDHRQANQPPQPDVPRRPQPNRDRAIDPRMEPVLAIDGIKPAPDIVDPEAEAYERVRLEIDVAKIDRAGSRGADKAIVLPVDAGVTDRTFGVVPNRELLGHHAVAFRT